MILNVVGGNDMAELPLYPVDPDARLDSHGFIQWEFRRWMSSDMRWESTHECKSMWFELLNTAQSETPVGTLPTNLHRLANMIQPKVDPKHFEQLCQLKFGPLHGWVHCLCGDEVRFMHPVVTRIVLSAFSSRANHAARVEAASESRKLVRLTDDIGQIAPKVAQDRRKVRWINSHIEELVQQRGGTRRTPHEFHAAIQACIAEERKGRFPEKSET